MNYFKSVKSGKKIIRMHKINCELVNKQRIIEVYRSLSQCPLDRWLEQIGWLVYHFCRPKIWWNSIWLHCPRNRAAFPSGICTKEWLIFHLHWPNWNRENCMIFSYWHENETLHEHVNRVKFTWICKLDDWIVVAWLQLTLANISPNSAFSFCKWQTISSPSPVF